MDFDFHTSYANFTTVELLKIVLQKELYQVAAVEAAEKILQSRNVTEEEKTTAAEAINEDILHVQQKKEQGEKIKNSIALSVRRFVFPKKRNTVYQIRLFCIIYSILWLIASIPFFRDIFWMFTPRQFLITILLLTIQAGYVFCFYWLYKLNRKGWVLAMLYFSFTLAGSVYDFFSWKPYSFLTTSNRLTYLYAFIYAVAILYFFNRKDVLRVLQVSRKLYIKTACGIGIIILLYILSKTQNLSYYFS